MARKQISKKVRFEVFKRDSFKCQYCGDEPPNAVLHVDHIHPVSKDGDNDLLNLITSCQACNLGKSATLISDQSAIKKQKDMLNELNAKREQLEMMVKWRGELKTLIDTELNECVKYWESIVTGFSVNDFGKSILLKLIKSHGFLKVTEAIDISTAKYLEADSEGSITQVSVETSFNKLGAIIGFKNKPEYAQKLAYIRGIARNRFSYINEKMALTLLEDAYQNQIKSNPDETSDSIISYLRDITCSARNWSDFKSSMLDIASE